MGSLRARPVARARLCIVRSIVRRALKTNKQLTSARRGTGLLSSLAIFTSMFVERMEVLEYRQKFEVELSTFPDSTNTTTPRKLVFSLTCVCLSVCVCEKVCQWISYERVDRFR